MVDDAVLEYLELSSSTHQRGQRVRSKFCDAAGRALEGDAGALTSI